MLDGAEKNLRGEWIPFVENIRRTNGVKANTIGGQCDRIVTCDNWQRIWVFGGGPWNKAR